MNPHDSVTRLFAYLFRNRLSDDADRAGGIQFFPVLVHCGSKHFVKPAFRQTHFGFPDPGTESNLLDDFFLLINESQFCLFDPVRLEPADGKLAGIAEEGVPFRSGRDVVIDDRNLFDAQFFNQNVSFPSPGINPQDKPGGGGSVADIAVFGPESPFFPFPRFNHVEDGIPVAARLDGIRPAAVVLADTELDRSVVAVVLTRLHSEFQTAHRNEYGTFRQFEFRAVYFDNSVSRL